VKTIVEWITYKTTLETRPPLAKSWGSDHQLFPRLAEAGAKVDYEDRSGAFEIFERALKLRDQAKAVRAVPEDDLALAIARGEITAEAAAKVAGKRNTVADAARVAEERATLSRAAHHGLNLAGEAVHAYGESRYHPELKAMADDAVAAGDDERFWNIQALAAMYRRRKLAGLSAAMVAHDLDSESWLYAFASPLFVYRTRCSTAVGRQLTPLTTRALAAGAWAISYSLRGAPMPKLVDLAEARPSLYTGAELISNVGRDMLAQDEELRRLAPPTQKKLRSAAFGG
jgi:hypothetical protein